MTDKVEVKKDAPAAPSPEDEVVAAREKAAKQEEKAQGELWADQVKASDAYEAAKDKGK